MTDWEESRSMYCPMLPSLKKMAAKNRRLALLKVPTNVADSLKGSRECLRVSAEIENRRMVDPLLQLFLSDRPAANVDVLI